jgi:predicted amidohydrolase/8-oxo-dGTP pyrophosphatase MutT (NUDIX family)
MEALCPSDAELVIYPEMATSGYVFENRDQLWDTAEDLSGSSVTAMRDLAERYGNYLVFGFPEKSGDSLYNSAAVVGPNGFLSVYRKAHLFASEPDYFQAGQSPWPVYDINGVKVGVMICFDWFFPESVRCMALAGAEIIAHPSNLVLPYCQQAMLTRSLENCVYTATCNRIGSEGSENTSYTFTGQSQITGPDGERIVQAAIDLEEVIMADIIPARARIKMAGPGVPLFDRRRPDLYQQIVDEKTNKPYRLNVAIIVVNDAGFVLVGERSDRPGAWQIPQGGIEEGETPEVAAMREAQEELGTDQLEILARSGKSYRYDFPEWLSSQPIAKKFKGQDQIYFVMKFKANAKPSLQDSDGEFCNFSWMPPEHLIERTIEFKRDIYKQAFKDLEGWISSKK